MAETDKDVIYDALPGINKEVRQRCYVAFDACLRPLFSCSSHSAGDWSCTVMVIMSATECSNINDVVRLPCTKYLKIHRSPSMWEWCAR